MQRHRADVFSLLCGLSTLGLGLLLLSGGIGKVPMEWVGPAVAIGVGILILAAARPGRDADQEPEPASDLA